MPDPETLHSNASQVVIDTYVHFPDAITFTKQPRRADSEDAKERGRH